MFSINTRINLQALKEIRRTPCRKEKQPLFRKGLFLRSVSTNPESSKGGNYLAEDKIIELPELFCYLKKFSLLPVDRRGT